MRMLRLRSRMAGQPSILSPLVVAASTPTASTERGRPGQRTESLLGWDKYVERRSDALERGHRLISAPDLKLHPVRLGVVALVASG